MLPEPYCFMFAAIGIDFEGSISLHRSKVKDRLKFTVEITISGTSKILLSSFQTKVGFGYVYSNENDTTYRSEVYNWRLRRIEIRKYLPLIKPHLVLKQEQANLTLEALTIIKAKQKIMKNSGSRRSEEDTDKLDILYDKMKLLNKCSMYKQPEKTDSEKLFIELRKRGV